MLENLQIIIKLKTMRPVDGISALRHILKMVFFRDSKDICSPYLMRI